MQYFVFFKQKTAYELRISDWSSDVCSSDLKALNPAGGWSPTAAAAFFKKYPPLSSAGKVRYAEALMATGDRAGAVAAARDPWTSGPLSTVDEPTVIGGFSKALTPADKDARQDMFCRTEEGGVGRECVRAVCIGGVSESFKKK